MKALSFVSALLVCAPAAAQSLRVPGVALRVPMNAGAQAEPEPPTQPRARGPRAARPRAFLAGRALIASGSVLLSVGAPIAGLTHGVECYEHDRRPVVARSIAATTLAAGAAAVLTGAVMLAIAHRRWAPRPMTRWRRAGLGIFTVLTYFSLGGVLTMLAFSDLIGCGSS